MRTNKIFAMAAFVAMTLGAVSCAKDGGENQVKEDIPAGMGLTISFPQIDTRAADGNAVQQDVAVQDIDVFIFDAATGAAVTGSGTVTKDNFDHGADNTYTLKTPIATVAGTMNIYVGINLPVGLNTANGEAVFKNEFANAAALFDNVTADGPAMLGMVTGKNIVAGAADNNETAVNIERMVAKVMAKTSSSLSTTPTAVDSPKFSVLVDLFTVGNLAAKAYPVQRKSSGTPAQLLTPGDAVNAKATTAKTSYVAAMDLSTNPMIEIAASDATNARVGRYVPEHSTSTLYQRGEATYAVIRAELTPTHYTTAVNGVIDETSIASAPFTGSIYTIENGGRVYFVNDVTILPDVLAALGLTNDPSNYDEYKTIENKLYTFYYVYIARGVTPLPANYDKLAVYRNRVYDIVINSVKTIGQPGDPDQPNQPDPDGLQDPDEPVFETPATLDVHVDVLPWSYEEAPTDLE